MVAYNFKAEWGPAILTGIKRRTIRAKGTRRHVRPGERFTLYQGMRTKWCRQLGTAIADTVQDVQIDFDEIVVGIADDLAPIRTTIFRRADLDDFARLDGFKDWDGFAEFFQRVHRPTLVFVGVVISWRDFKSAVAA